MRANHIIITKHFSQDYLQSNAIMPVLRNYKFRLYPTVQQEKRLQNNLNVCKWVYNKFVESAQTGFLTRNDMNYMLTKLKQQESWLYNYHSKMLQMISTQLEGPSTFFGLILDLVIEFSFYSNYNNSWCHKIHSYI